MYTTSLLHSGPLEKTPFSMKKKKVMSIKKRRKKQIAGVGSAFNYTVLIELKDFLFLLLIQACTMKYDRDIKRRYKSNTRT